ncbi:MAG: patatin-like phospholipase family protein [Xanthobacteraceae bacterium]
MSNLIPGRTGTTIKKINLALQGGGAHGAFTWGVLDHLLADGRLAIEGISGASAGAMNAIMLADGLARGGPQEAQKRLAEFWRAASLGGNLPPLQRAVVDRMLSFLPIEGTPVQAWLDALSQLYSPYDVNPLNINPLRDLIERFVDFEAVRNCEALQLFVTATNVYTGRLHVFSRKKISAQAIMASACLPNLFRAVEIDGVPYWDGGYLGNPVIFPFFRTTDTEDVLVVQINPLVRHSVPTSAQEIMNRVNEITFNSSLLDEFRAIEFVGRLIDQRRLPRGRGPGQYRRINVHRIVLDSEGKAFTAASKLSNDYEFFEMLRDNGRRAARRFLDEHFDHIGVKSTVDLRTEVPAVVE